MLSRKLSHIALQQLVQHIRRGSSLAYARVSGLSDFEWRILARVCDMPGLSINELGSVTDRSVAHVSRTVKRLVSLGLLERQPVGGGPGVAINPTPAGEKAYAPLIELAVESERELTQGLTAEELTILQRVMAVMRENAIARLVREQTAAAAGGPGRPDPHRASAPRKRPPG